MAESPPDGRGTGEAQVHEIRLAGGPTTARLARRDRIRTGGPRRAIVLGLAGLVAGLGMLAGLWAPAPRPAPEHPRASVAPAAPGAAGYPEWCVSITIPVARRDDAAHHVDRRPLCGRYTGYTTAVRPYLSARHPRRRPTRAG